MKIRVLVAADSERVSQLLTLQLNQAPDVVVISQSFDQKELLNHLETEHGNVDVVVLDTQIPLMSGFETSARIHQFYPDIKIIVLIVYEDGLWIKKCLESGAHGCISMSDRFESIIEGVRVVHRGAVYLSERVSGHPWKN